MPLSCIERSERIEAEDRKAEGGRRKEVEHVEKLGTRDLMREKLRWLTSRSNSLDKRVEQVEQCNERAGLVFLGGWIFLVGVGLGPSW